MDGDEWALAGRSKAPALAVVGALSFILMCFFDALIWSKHRGTYSVVTALPAISAKTPEVDIDRNGLALPIIGVVMLAAVVVYKCFRIDLSESRNLGIFVCAVMGGGFLIIEMAEQPFIRT